MEFKIQSGWGRGVLNAILILSPHLSLYLLFVSLSPPHVFPLTLPSSIPHSLRLIFTTLVLSCSWLSPAHLNTPHPHPTPHLCHQIGELSVEKPVLTSNASLSICLHPISTVREAQPKKSTLSSPHLVSTPHLPSSPLFASGSYSLLLSISLSSILPPPLFLFASLFLLIFFAFVLPSI